MGRLRGRFNATSLVAVAALVFAMSGGAYAAGRYVITSTKQISPKALKSLTGKAGPAGKNGANGATGPAGAVGGTGPAGPQGSAGVAGAAGKEGPAGKEGKEGKTGATGFTATLPKGATETGTWGEQSTAEDAIHENIRFSPISFAIPLEAALTGANVFFVMPGDTSHEAQCPGSPAAPEAAEGDLCVYVGAIVNQEPFEGGGPVENPSSANAGRGAAASGATVWVTAIGEEAGSAFGTWAVTGS
jgi:hypothetical protein